MRQLAAYESWHHRISMEIEEKANVVISLSCVREASQHFPICFNIHTVIGIHSVALPTMTAAEVLPSVGKMIKLSPWAMQELSPMLYGSCRQCRGASICGQNYLTLTLQLQRCFHLWAKSLNSRLGPCSNSLSCSMGVKCI